MKVGSPTKNTEKLNFYVFTYFIKAHAEEEEGYCGEGRQGGGGGEHRLIGLGKGGGGEH